MRFFDLAAAPSCRCLQVGWGCGWVVGSGWWGVCICVCVVCGVCVCVWSVCVAHARDDKIADDEEWQVMKNGR